VKVVWLHSPKEGTDEEYLKFYHSLAKVKYCTNELVGWNSFFP
jgi:hypothetical protein